MAEGGRRSPGEATVRELPNGRWRAEIMLDGARYSANGGSRAEALAAVGKKRRQHEDGVRTKRAERENTAAYLRAWVAGLRGTTGEKNRLAHANAVEHYLVPAVGALALAKVRPEHLRALLGRLQVKGMDRPGRPGKPLAPRTINGVRTAARLAFRQAVEDGLLPAAADPTAPIRPLKVAKAERPVLSAAQQARFLAETADGRHHALFVLALRLACRQGELLALKWEDVDWLRGHVTVRRTLKRVTGRGKAAPGKAVPVFGPPKTAAALRGVYLPPSATCVLRAHRDRQDAEKAAKGAGYRDYGLVFATGLGTPLLGWNVTRRDFAAAAERAGLPEGFRFHDLRHTAVSTYIAAGVPIPEVARIAGHASTAVTTQIYAHVIPSSTGEAGRRYDRYLGLDAPEDGENAPGGPPDTPPITPRRK